MKMRKNTFFIIAIINFFCQCAFSQITFEKSYRDGNIYSGLGKTVCADETGYFLSGLYYKKTNDVISLYGTAIIRTNLYGDTLWTKTFPLETVYGNMALITKSHPIEYVFVSNPSNMSTKSDVKVTKKDSLGNVIWSNTIVKQNYDESNQIIQTNDDGYLIAGYSNSLPGITTPYPYDAYIIKLDSQGDTLWTKMIGDKNKSDYAQHAIETSDSDYLITGFEEQNNKVLLIKMKTNGDILWVKKYDSESGCYTRAFSIVETKDKNYIIVGTKYKFGMSFSDVYALKVNNVGDVIWEKTYHFDESTSGSKVLALDSGFLIAGKSGETAFLLKIGNDGNLLWSKTVMTYSDPLFPYSSGAITSIDECKDGGFIFTNEYSLSLIKTDTLGCVKPVTLPIVGERNVSINDNITYKVNNVRGNTNIWKSSRGNILTGQGTDSITISWDKVGLDSIKIFVENDCGIDSTALNVNIRECVELKMSEIQHSGNLTEFYINKYEGKSPRYQWSLDKGIILSGQGSDCILVSWSEFGNAQVSVKVTNDCSIFENILQVVIDNLDDVLGDKNADLKIYPNPTKDELTIDSYGLIVRKLEVFDLSGKIVNCRWLNDKSINVSALQRGIYFIKFETDKGIVMKRFVKK